MLYKVRNCEKFYVGSCNRDRARLWGQGGHSPRQIQSLSCRDTLDTKYFNTY